MKYKRVKYKSKRETKINQKKILFWIPRILAIIYIIFISLFAFDSEPLGILIGLIPSIILLGILILAWFKPKIGGIIFLILGIIFTIVFDTYRTILIFVIISLPLIIIGILFLLNKKKRK